MADYSKDFQIAYDERADSCTLLFRCFDTPNSVRVFGVSSLGDAAVEDVLVGIHRYCLGVHRLWSFSMPDSDVSRLNSQVESMRVDKRTAELLAAMQRFNASEPVFDFTIGPASFLWKHATSLPEPAQVDEALSLVGARRIRIEGDVVRKDDPRMKVDVGGAAKGYVADELARMLRAAGVASADVDLGGNLYMLGDHPEGRPWRVAVRVPEGVKAERVVLEVSDCSVVTSGSYERFAEIDGRRYQHIIDARTGRPAESDIVSATVVSASSLEADLLATTACLLGSDALEDLRQRHPACTFVAITADGRTLLLSARENTIP